MVQKKGDSSLEVPRRGQEARLYGKVSVVAGPCEADKDRTAGHSLEGERQRVASQRGA